MTLDLAGRAALLGVSCRELVDLGNLDPRMFAGPTLETEGGITRMKRWIASGNDADPRHVEFIGDDSVRAIVVEVVRCLPAPARAYAVGAVTFIEVGCGTAAWIARMPPTRELPGDVPHLVAINGRTGEDLAGTISHELGHGWHRPIVETVPPLSMLSEREAITARILFAQYTGNAAHERDRWIRARVHSELLADRQAEAWGIVHHGPSAFELRRHFAAEYDNAAALAVEDAAETQHQAPADVARAASLSVQGGGQ